MRAYLDCVIWPHVRAVLLTYILPRLGQKLGMSRTDHEPLVWEKTLSCYPHKIRLILDEPRTWKRMNDNEW